MLTVALSWPLPAWAFTRNPEVIEGHCFGGQSTFSHATEMIEGHSSAGSPYLLLTSALPVEVARCTATARPRPCRCVPARRAFWRDFEGVTSQLSNFTGCVERGSANAIACLQAKSATAIIRASSLLPGLLRDSPRIDGIVWVCVSGHNDEERSTSRGECRESRRQARACAEGILSDRRCCHVQTNLMRRMRRREEGRRRGGGRRRRGGGRRTGGGI